MTAGATTQVSAALRDVSGNQLTGRTVTWSSSANTVASVNGSGLVTAVSPGTATITAASEGRTGTMQMTVTTVPVATITLAAATTNISPAQSTQITATLKDAQGNLLTGRSVAWQSSSQSTATVDNNGLVSAVAAGTTTITASSEGRSGTVQVSVSLPTVVTVEVTPGTVALAPGQGAILAAVGRDAQQVNIPDRPVQWSTNAPAVATVNGSGQVTAVAQGAATISATIDGVIGTASVTVSTVPVASITLNTATVTLPVGEATVLVATPRDGNSNPLPGRVVTWTSTNLNVVNGYVYDNEAVITGLLVGAATVTATSEGKSVSVLVSVVTPPTSTVCTQIAGALIFGSDGQYLGRLTNRFDSQSAFNEFGQYGSPYGANSTNNQYGQYGSPYSTKSARNPYASSPPILVKNDVAIAYYTVNTLKSPRVTPAFAATCNFP